MKNLILIFVFTSLYGQIVISQAHIIIGNSTATGPNSFAAGNNSSAVGEATIAMGSNAQALGDFSLSMGDQTTSTGKWSQALGFGSHAQGDYSLAAGFYNFTRGFSIGIGAANVVTGIGAIGLGRDNQSYGDASMVLGTWSKAMTYGEIVLGAYSEDYSPIATDSYQWEPEDRLFVIANGNGDGAGNGTYSNALVMLKNGDTKINGQLSIEGNLTKHGFYAFDNGQSGFYAEDNNDNGFLATDNAVGFRSETNDIGMEITNALSGVNISGTGGPSSKGIEIDNIGNGVVITNSQKGIKINSSVKGIESTAPIAAKFNGHVQLSNEGILGPLNVNGPLTVNGLSTLDGNLDVLGAITSPTITTMQQKILILQHEMIIALACCGSPSDRKLKESIELAQSPILQKLNSLKLYHYDYKTEEYPTLNLSEEKQYGVIAQELQEVFPSLVTLTTAPQLPGDESESQVTLEYLRVKYNAMVPYLVKAIQELSAENENMKKVNAQLIDANAETVARLEILEQHLMNDKKQLTK